MNGLRGSWESVRYYKHLVPNGTSEPSSLQLVDGVMGSYTDAVKTLRFDWDPAKAATNRRKHRVSFTEAQTVFLDEEALLIPDEEHSKDEERFVLLGLSAVLRILVVCHCYRESDEVIRIISARRANAIEKELYDSRRVL